MRGLSILHTSSSSRLQHPPFTLSLLLHGAPFKRMLKNSLLLAISNLPLTIMYIVLTAALAYVIYEFTIIPLSFLVFMGISLIAWFYSLFLKRIFEKNGAVLVQKDESGKED